MGFHFRKSKLILYKYYNFKSKPYLKIFNSCDEWTTTLSDPPLTFFAFRSGIYSTSFFITKNREFLISIEFNLKKFLYTDRIVILLRIIKIYIN